jgi:CheY-like chemotaxis protein
MAAELVLIVDDNERNAKLLRDVLEAAGMRTLSASTAAEGLSLAIDALPDLVLMDLRLPDLDGAEARTRLAADPRTAGIPVVAVSALPLSHVGVWWRDAGFAGYLEKPIDVLDLPDQVRHYCAGPVAEG